MQCSPDPRLPKAKANALHSIYSMHAQRRQHHAPSSLRRTHSLLFTTITDYQPSTLLSALHNILSSVLSDIIHSAFPVHCRAVLLAPTPGVTPHHRCYLLQHKICFLRHRRLGFLKQKWRWRHLGFLDRTTARAEQSAFSGHFLIITCTTTFGHITAARRPGINLPVTEWSDYQDDDPSRWTQKRRD